MTYTHCPKCGNKFGNDWRAGQVQHTKHHILPRRFQFGSELKISLCRGCHDLLERRIPVERKMPRSFYFLVVNNFLGFEAVKEDK